MCNEWKINSLNIDVYVFYRYKNAKTVLSFWIQFFKNLMMIHVTLKYKKNQSKITNTDYILLTENLYEANYIMRSSVVWYF